MLIDLVLCGEVIAFTQVLSGGEPPDIFGDVAELSSERRRKWEDVIDMKVGQVVGAAPEKEMNGVVIKTSGVCVADIPAETTAEPHENRDLGSGILVGGGFSFVFSDLFRVFLTPSTNGFKPFGVVGPHPCLVACVNVFFVGQAPALIRCGFLRFAHAERMASDQARARLG